MPKHKYPPNTDLRPGPKQIKNHRDQEVIPRSVISSLPCGVQATVALLFGIRLKTISILSLYECRNIRKFHQEDEGKKKQQTKLNRADDKAYNDKRGIITANCRPDEQRKPIRNKSPKSTFIVQSCYRNLSKARHRGKPRGEGKSVNKMENPKDGQAL